MVWCSSLPARSCVPPAHFHLARNFSATSACDTVRCIREKSCVPACHTHDLAGRQPLAAQSVQVVWRPPGSACLFTGEVQPRLPSSLSFTHPSAISKRTSGGEWLSFAFR